MRAFIHLLPVEARRALSRRAVWALVSVALVGLVVLGALAFLSSNDFDPSVAEPDIARLTDLWLTGGGDGTLTPALIFLAVGAMIGGATVTGADWQNGTIITLCTWEVRRVPLLLARIVATALLATAIGAALLLLYCLSLVPTYLLRGSIEGADGGFWTSLLGAIVRMSVLTGLAAALAASVASIGRRTAVALGVAFAYLSFVEGAVRGLWPERSRWLIAENAIVFVTGADLEGAPFTRGVPVATLTLFGYVAFVTGLALVAIRQRDMTGVG
ncbi:MAG: hypothetical protein WKF43_00585 [Acidimicrobiales bacterium]